MGKPTVDDVLGASAIVLNVGGKAVDAAGVPGVGQACELLLAFIRAIQNMKGNDAKRLEISKHIGALACIVADIKEKVTRDKGVYPRALEDRVMQLNSELVQYGKVASRLAAMRAPERLFKNQEISDALTDLSEGVKMSCERTNTRALFDIEVNQGHHGQAINQIQESVARILKSSEAVIDSVTKLPCANAAFDSINLDNKSEVLAGTRVAVMEEVERWGSTACDERVFWLRGAAGTGKSTIAKSVAAKYKRANRLGASFFFVQGVQDLGDTRLLITTLACHLARLDGPVGTAIKNAAHNYLATQTPGEKNSSSQFNDLLFEPLKNLERAAEPIIIVLDALDEASDRIAVVSNLGRLTRQLVTLPINIKLFVTSRPDPQIEAVLSGASLLILHDIEKTILDHDIKLYIEHAFSEIQDSKKAFQYTPEDIESLVDNSGGLFIYVSTAIKLLKDSIDPSKMLKGLNRHKSDHMLDQLYLQVLERAFGIHNWDNNISENREAWDEKIRILGTIVLSQDRHSCSTLASLLDQRPEAIRDALSHLGAVILVPQGNDLPVRIIHTSFTDFIVDATRCTNPHFAINTIELHSYLAKECIHHMNWLLEDNPCQISDPYALNSEIPDLDEHIDQCLPYHLQYASHSWAYHLSLSTYSLMLKEQLRVFCKFHLLQWLEVMSFFGRVDLAITHLDMAFNWIKANEASPSTPKTSLFLKMEVSMEAILFSADGTRGFIGFLDGTIRIWDFSFNSEPATSKHKYHCNIDGVVFSPDCTRICTWISGEKHTRVWHLSTGCLLFELKGHTRSVTSAAFSPNSTQIASTSEDKTIRIWDSVKGHQVQKLNMRRTTLQDIHFIVDNQITFSEDGFHICVYSWFLKFYWDIRSGKVISESEQPFDEAKLAESGISLSHHNQYLAPSRGDLKEENTWIL
ncbi:hypothetical protein EYR40_007149 [Pleurotus pulmonarius]|nr:hypothetical protein EYR36_003568 [Pleurotus pulmonarius]KAF4600043.1 hypothetical protein EYR40_007149 [Pleurotus pulmonarius]